MIEPTRIGFSTTDAILSRLVRWLTRSQVSHAFLVYFDVDFDREMVMEAVGAGFRIVPLDKFATHNRIVEIVTPRHSIDEGLRAAVEWLGESYDAPGLVGMAVLLAFRALRRRTRTMRNLIASPRALFCSEAVARACLACRYPGFDRDPETTTPQDLYAFFRSEAAVAPLAAAPT
jgi:MYXO-CTERM domain-containing protein